MEVYKYGSQVTNIFALLFIVKLVTSKRERSPSFWLPGSQYVFKEKLRKPSTPDVYNAIRNMCKTFRREVIKTSIRTTLGWDLNPVPIFNSNPKAMPLSVF